jgi:hypothetical protein
MCTDIYRYHHHMRVYTHVIIICTDIYRYAQIYIDITIICTDIYRYHHHMRVYTQIFIICTDMYISSSYAQIYTDITIICTDIYRYARIYIDIDINICMHYRDPYKDASDLVALERFYRRIVYREHCQLDYYDGYRYCKDMGARLSASLGPWLRARLRTNLRYQGMILKAHAKHCSKVEREHKEVLFAR